MGRCRTILEKASLHLIPIAVSSSSGRTVSFIALSRPCTALQVDGTWKDPLTDDGRGDVHVVPREPVSEADVGSTLTSCLTRRAFCAVSPECRCSSLRSNVSSLVLVPDDRSTTSVSVGLGHLDGGPESLQ